MLCGLLGGFGRTRVLGEGLANDISGDISSSTTVQTVVTLCGDFNLNGNVDLVDFASFTLCFDGGVSCSNGVDADLDNDGDVDLIDYALMLDQLTGP